MAGDQGQLWGADPHEDTFTVGELADVIAADLARRFPTDVWVKGEVHNLRTMRSGHRYFDLAEPTATGRPSAVLSVALLAQERRWIAHQLADAPDVELRDGLDVRIRARPGFWKSGGRLQLKMTALDPIYTLGVIEAGRQRVLRRLRDEGLVDRNGRLPLPLAPLRVGLVTSLGSAAEHDVVDELMSSPYAFRITAVDARVQGPRAERSLVAALARLARADVELILVVRGGGARTDLAAFDGDQLARQVATLAIPVWSGVGHEVDTTVVDAVVHTAHKTPTACAQALVERVGAAARRVDVHGRALAQRVGRLLDRADHRLRAATLRASGAAPRRLERADDWLRMAVGQLGPTARRHLATADVRLGDAVDSLATTTRMLAEHGRALDAVEARVAAADPARLMARGWSLTRSPRGVVRSVHDVHRGDHLVTIVADGAIASVVEEDPE